MYVPVLCLPLEGPTHRLRTLPHPPLLRCTKLPAVLWVSIYNRVQFMGEVIRTPFLTSCPGYIS